jgi:hypothetical protein
MMWLQNHIGRRWRLGTSGLSPKVQATYLNQLMKFFINGIKMYRKPRLLVPQRFPQYIRHPSPSSSISPIAYVAIFVTTSAKKAHQYATNILLVQEFLK